jgi:hypothetical protein
MRSIDPSIAPQGNCPMRVISIPKGSSGAVFDGWERPADWLALPLLATTDQIFVGLFAVYNTANNWVTLKCSGNYSVDWGDGSAIENVNAGVTVTHDVAWANVSSGTLTSLGYKQVIITCTPQNGQTFSSIDITQKPAGTTSGQTSQWLDISVEMNNSGVFLPVSNPTYPCSLLKGFRWLGDNTVTAWSNFLYKCVSLECVKLNTKSATYIYGLYSASDQQSSLKTIFDSGFGNATNLNYALANCNNLLNVPVFDTSKCTNFAGFYSCYNSQNNTIYYPLLNTSQGAIFNNFYVNNVKGTKFPLLDTGNATDFNNMHYGCSSMLEIPNYNTSKVTNFSGFLCNALGNVATLPVFNTSSGVNFSGWMDSYYGSQVTVIPEYDFRNGTNFTNCFNNMTRVVSALCYGARFSISFASMSMAKAAIELIFTNLGIAYPGATRTVTVTGNPGNDTVISRSAGTTAGSSTITQANTASLVAGMLVSGPGISEAVNVTFQETGDMVTKAGHGLANGTVVSFPAITTTTGIAAYTIYYVVNQTTDTFQVSDTVGGSPINLTNDGSGTLLYPAFIQSIVTNTSITLTAPASATATVTAVHSLLDTSKATLKGWSIAR